MQFHRFGAPRLRSYVFDLDGVLCTGSPFTVSLEKVYGIDRLRWAPFFSGPFADCLVGRRDLKIELAPHLPEIGWREGVDSLLRFWFESEKGVCPDALACVRLLRKRGHRCYLGTNQERHRTAFIRKEMGMDSEFDGILSSSLIGWRKPAAEFYARARETIGEADILLVDDSAANVEGARAAGWKAWHYQGVADLANLVSLSAGYDPA